MDWITKYQTVFFDFDGLLVNTEQLHYQAYKKAISTQGEILTWDFPTFTSIAHRSATGLRELITKQFPFLIERLGWQEFYQEKTKSYLALLKSGGLELMPGVSRILSLVQKKGLSHCVVTNSTRQQVEMIKTNLPLLCQIPHWITREDYTSPKPAPDGYLKAIDLLNGNVGGRIGFEDSLRGIDSLKGAGITPVLICSPDHPQMKDVEEELFYFPSFDAFLERFH